MKLKISHRPEAFFDLFTESAENLRTGAELLQDLIVDYRDVELKAQRVADREHDGDEVTHAIIRRLNTTFVTPMDREACRCHKRRPSRYGPIRRITSAA